MTRRKALSLGASAFSVPLLAQMARQQDSFSRIASLPDSVIALTASASETLTRIGETWRWSDVQLTTHQNGDSLTLRFRSPQTPVLRLRLRWQMRVPSGLRFLGDDWERSYGTLAWRGMEPERVMPWYFLAASYSSTVGCGVQTGAAALCFWQVDPDGVSLWLDLRNGGSAAKLGDREMAVASVISRHHGGLRPFQAAQQFCRALCPAPRLPSAPVYGSNNWYYAYGKSSAEDILADSKRISNLALSSANRPFMVVDDGWSPNATAGPWSHGNDKFGDMPKLAADMKAAGVQPGIWFRPLFTKENVPAGWRLQSPAAEKEINRGKGFTIDPTVPEVRERIRTDVQTLTHWKFSLIKHDFSTYDLFGRWGFNMSAEITETGWSFADPTRTTAEIITALYRDLREAAGDALVLGCNTVGHLSAGLFELQRTGDDTSGRDWNRTRKMGVNTLAFRAPQHRAFFAIDADCVGLTQNIPWEQNRQWLDLLARSGTPLFVSLAPDAATAEVKAAVKNAFIQASQPQPTAEPQDWLTLSEPERWLIDGKPAQFHWFGNSGTSPFGS